MAHSESHESETLPPDHGSQSGRLGRPARVPSSGDAPAHKLTPLQSTEVKDKGTKEQAESAFQTELWT